MTDKGHRNGRLALGFTLFLCLAGQAAPLVTQDPNPRIAFVGRDSSVFSMREDAAAVSLAIEPLSLEELEAGEGLSRFDLIVLWRFRGAGSDEATERIRDRIREAKETKPGLRIVAASGRRLSSSFGDLLEDGLLEVDETISDYSGASQVSSENLKRLLQYLAITYLGRDGEVTPPEEVQSQGFHHPEHEPLFSSVSQLLEWSRQRGFDVDAAPRAAVLSTFVHLHELNREPIAALIRALEARGFLAAVVIEREGPHEDYLRALKPDVILHTFTSRDTVALREELDAPHLQAAWLRRLSIEEWRSTTTRAGIYPSLIAHEALGTIEPFLVSGRSDEDSSRRGPLEPIESRIEKIADRAARWARLRRQPNDEKRIVILYPNPDSSKGDLTLGTPDHRQLDCLESLVRVVHRLQDEGYRVTDAPADKAELLLQLQDHGRGLGAHEEEAKDRLARSGTAVLVPVEDYARWFEELVPEPQRREVISRWGEVPGELSLWTSDDGQRYFVFPKLDFGNVLLMPKSAPGIATLFEDLEQNKSLRKLPPSHASLAHRFWIEHGFGADARVVWGSFAVDFLKPEKPAGLTENDWPDILAGTLPDIRPFSVTALNFSILARRRIYALLVGHLTAPTTTADLDDELLNLSGDVVKFQALEPGALKERFRATISETVRASELDEDLDVDLGGRELTDEEVDSLAAYLNAVALEPIADGQHVFGEPPSRDKLVPWIVTCLRREFLDALGNAFQAPQSELEVEGDRERWLRPKAESVMRGFLEGQSISEAIVAAGGGLPPWEPDEALAVYFERARALADGFRGTTLEMDSLVSALSGRFVPPGPSNPPERNPGVVPTGRNMIVIDPDEVPSRSSWTLGCELIDELLTGHLERHGRYPQKLAFSIHPKNTFADFGVMEAQILYLIGVRPVWDEAQRVYEVEVIPREELGRPRIDAFVETTASYGDQLEGRMRLLDEAFRLVGSLDEEGNPLPKNTEQARVELLARGVEPDRAEVLARARMFSLAPNVFGSAIHDVLFESTGLWEERSELVEIYADHHDFAYTDGAWGVKSPEAYRIQLQKADVVLKNLVRFNALGGRAYYSGGNLALTIEHFSGKTPEYLLSDLRLPDRARIVSAEEAIRLDLRASLLNRKWIEGQMAVGYGGAGMMASWVWHVLGWKINREHDVKDDVFERITDVYVRDSKELGLREWFDRENPYAFQDLTGKLLETVRKGYWAPDPEVVREIAIARADSIARFGGGGGESNEKLEAFMAEVLSPAPEIAAKVAEDAASESVSSGAASSAESAPQSEPETVRGRRMTPVKEEESPWTPWILSGGFGLLLAIGLWRRTGSAA